MATITLVESGCKQSFEANLSQPYYKNVHALYYRYTHRQILDRQTDTHTLVPGKQGSFLLKICNLHSVISKK